MLFIELYIIECDFKNQRFRCDDSSQILLVESPNLLYILTALLQWLWAQGSPVTELQGCSENISYCRAWWIREKTPLPKPASGKPSPTSSSTHSNGFSMGMVPLNRKQEGTAEPKPSSAEEGLQTEESLRWQGLPSHIYSRLCDKS